MNGSKSHDIKTRWGFARVNEEITCQVRIRYYKNMQISEKDNFSEISHAKKIFLKACVLKTEDDRVACLWCYHLFQNWSDKNIISNKKGRKKKPQSSSKGGEKFWTFKLANILLHDGCVLYQCQNGLIQGIIFPLIVIQPRDPFIIICLSKLYHTEMTWNTDTSDSPYRRLVKFWTDQLAFIHKITSLVPCFKDINFSHKISETFYTMKILWFWTCKNQLPAIVRCLQTSINFFFLQLFL